MLHLSQHPHLPPRQKKPNPPPYVPKQRLPASKDKAQTQGEVKPRPRPRYTDKARKNAKNKKDKAGGEAKSAPVEGEDGGEIQNSVTKPDVKEEQLEDTDVQVKGQPESTSLEADVASRLEAISLLEEEEEEEEEESWDTLFNDDGDSLEQHLPAEVRVFFQSG